MDIQINLSDHTPSLVTTTCYETGLRTLPVKLSVREREVLIMIADGLSGKQIAARLGITTKTVEYHRYRLCKTVGRSGTAALVRYAIRSGYIDA